MRGPRITAGGREAALTRCVYRTNSHSPGPRALRLTAGSRPPLLVTRPTTVSECVRNRAGHTITGHTSGSRPPLVMRVRLCIAKVAIPSAGERARNKSGGRKPPVVAQT